MDNISQKYTLKLPDNCLSGHRIDRKQNRKLKAVNLDCNLLADMANNSLAALVTECPLRDTINHILHVIERTAEGIWIIVTVSSKETDALIYEADLRRLPLGVCVPNRKVTVPEDSPILTSPEWIALLGKKFTSHQELVGVHLIDPDSKLHRTRPHIRKKQIRDRPNELAKFIASKDETSATLPLFIWTANKGNSIIPDNIMSAYALNGVMYIGGSTLRHT